MQIRCFEKIQQKFFDSGFSSEVEVQFPAISLLKQIPNSQEEQIIQLEIFITEVTNQEKIMRQIQGQNIGKEELKILKQYSSIQNRKSENILKQVILDAVQDQQTQNQKINSTQNIQAGKDSGSCQLI